MYKTIDLILLLNIKDYVMYNVQREVIKRMYNKAKQFITLNLHSINFLYIISKTNICTQHIKLHLFLLRTKYIYIF